MDIRSLRSTINHAVTIIKINRRGIFERAANCEIEKLRSSLQELNKLTTSLSDAARRELITDLQEQIDHLQDGGQVTALMAEATQMLESTRDRLRVLPTQNRELATA